MNTMKRTLAFSVVLLLGAVVALAEPGPSRRLSNRLFNDVIEMTRAGLGDDTIIAYVDARRARLDTDVSAGDLIRLRQAGVSEAVVRYIAGASGLEGNAGGPPGEVAYDSGGQASYPAEPSYGEDEAYPYPYAYGYPYWYSWYGYPYWYGGPYVSGTFFFGGGRSFHGRGGSGGGGHRGSGGRGHR